MQYKTYFDISNRLGVTHECDRQTDRHIAYAALHYLVRPEKNHNGPAQRFGPGAVPAMTRSLVKVSCVLCSSYDGYAIVHMDDGHAG